MGNNFEYKIHVSIDQKGLGDDVRKELSKVKWPNKKDMIKYSIATIVFVIFCGLFFYAIDIIFAFIKSLI